MEDHAWDWLDEDLKLDSESPLFISHSLWDDFAQNEAVVRNLFASAGTPPSHVIKDSVSSAFSAEKSDSPQPSSSWHISSDGSPPPLKRRRMLQFTMDEPIAFADPHETCSDSLLDACEDNQANGRSSSGSVWFMANEESISSVDDVVEQSAESWMAGCFSDSDTSDAPDLAVYPRDQVNGLPKTGLMNATDLGMKIRKTCRLEPSPEIHHPPSAKPKHILETRGKTSAKQVVRRSLAQGKCTPPSQFQPFREKLNPVAYPFALLKPSGIQGDVTLKDINQRINMAPPIVTKTSSDQSRGTASPSPSSSPFSGKSVVALTKIHTEGNGTITIMRTRS